MVSPKRRLGLLSQRSSADPTSQSNELGHTATTQSDYRWGKPSVVIDANGNDTEYAYDEVGRLRCLALPGDSVTGCTDAGSTAATIC